MIILQRNETYYYIIWQTQSKSSRPYLFGSGSHLVFKLDTLIYLLLTFVEMVVIVDDHQ
jgi:hypothetical protein